MDLCWWKARLILSLYPTCYTHLHSSFHHVISFTLFNNKTKSFLWHMAIKVNFTQTVASLVYLWAFRNQTTVALIPVLSFSISLCLLSCKTDTRQRHYLSSCICITAAPRSPYYSVPCKKVHALKLVLKLKALKLKMKCNLCSWLENGIWRFSFRSWFVRKVEMH